MDDCILAEKMLHQTNNNFNWTQTISSPVQVTQPSSTQDSFAKSNGPALSLYPLLFPTFFLRFSCAILSQAGPHCPRRLHRVKMVDGG